MQALEARVNRRVSLSSPLLEAFGVPVEVYQRTVLNAFVLQPELANCTPASIDAAIMRAINARLLPDGKEATIIPFKRAATFIPMIDGQVKLAHQATPGLTLRTRTVYREDTWEYSEGLYPRLEHVPNAEGSRTSNDVIAVYAVARTPRSSDPIYEVMLRGDIDRHRSYSPSGDRGGPWASHYQEMAQKTVLRKLLRRLPQPAGFSPFDDSPDLAAIETGVAPPLTIEQEVMPDYATEMAVPPATGEEVTLEVPPAAQAVTPQEEDAPAEETAADAPF